jgi:hypothetical protein
MKKSLIHAAIGMLLAMRSGMLNADSCMYEWAVLGAGPAGITVIGLLCDMGIAPEKIIWIDPEFNVGRLGQYYQSVPGNTRAVLYVDFLRACKTFSGCACPSWQALLAYDPQEACPLSYIIEPLQEITGYLREFIPSQCAWLTGLYPVDDTWQIELSEGQSLSARCVVLATGAKPIRLDYPVDSEIPLDMALQEAHIGEYITPEDTVAVVGSAHSAVLAMKFLYQAGCPRIINFYSKPLVYTYQEDGVTHHSHSGLKGTAACWAQTVLEGTKPASILRLRNSEAARAAWLPVCTKIVYAVGYERNPLPDIPGVQAQDYDKHTGRIAPGLFGIGIAFPEVIVDANGENQNKIGLNSFMEFALRQLPQWIEVRANHPLYEFEDLFHITVL